MSSHCKDSSTSRYLGAQPDPEGSGPSPQREPSEGNNSPSSSLVSDPWPSGWLAAESLKRPFPPSRLRAQVRNWVTHCFLRRTFLHFCQGPRTGSRLPGPGRSPAHATHSPAADRCLRVSVQLSTSWAPGCQRRVEGEGQEPQGCPQALRQQEPSGGSRVLHQPLTSVGTERVPAGARGQGSSIPPLPPAAGDGSRKCQMISVSFCLWHSCADYICPQCKRV